MTKGKTENRNMRKVTVRKINLTEQEPGFAFEGKFLGLATGAPFQAVDPKTNEVYDKSLTSAIFEDDAGERFSVIQDAGLRSAMSDAMIKEGDLIRVVKLPKAQLSRGRTMNQYDIYAQA